MKKILFLGENMLTGEHLDELVRIYGEFELVTHCKKVEDSFEAIEVARENNCDIIAVDDWFDEGVIMWLTSREDIYGKLWRVIKMTWDENGDARWQRVKYTVRRTKLQHCQKQYPVIV